MAGMIYYRDVIQLTEYVGIERRDVKHLKRVQGGHVLVTDDNRYLHITDKFVSVAIAKGIMTEPSAQDSKATVVI